MIDSLDDIDTYLSIFPKRKLTKWDSNSSFFGLFGPMKMGLLIDCARNIISIECEVLYLDPVELAYAYNPVVLVCKNID